MTTKLIQDCTDKELRNAIRAKGHKCNNFDETPVLIEKLRAAGVTGDSIEIEGKAPKAEKTPAKEKPRELVIVNIAASSEPGGDRPVELGFQGKFMLVPRDTWCEIPKGYFEALKDAVEERFGMHKGEDGLRKIDPVPRLVPRFPYQVWSGGGEPPNVMRPPTVAKAA